MSKAAFLAPTKLSKGMDIVILQSQCWGCGLWREVARGKIDEVTRPRETTRIKVKGIVYTLTYDKVVWASEAQQWLDLSKSISCPH